jgi:hypothetical protein
MLEGLTIVALVFIAGWLLTKDIDKPLRISKRRSFRV